MATWKPYRIADIVSEIDDATFVLPVIQRSLVWTEEKMELLFDTVLKGNSFGGIMVIKEERDTKPLFNFRPFTKDGNFIPSAQVNQLARDQFFVIDGQQRLQSFYIGLKGSINGKQLYFDLFSDYADQFDFKFEYDESKLPQKSENNSEREIPTPLWYSAKELLKRLKETNDDDQVAEEIISKNNIFEEKSKRCIAKNVKAFFNNILNAETIGIATVNVNKSLPEQENQQRIVELFRRLNDGGTTLSSFDLVASILKGFSWEMESFLNGMLEKYSDIGLNQDNLIKLIFLLQDNPNKEMASIQASDAKFAIENRERISATLKAVKDFLKAAKLYDYYHDGGRSFIPLFFVAYHIYHLDIDDNAVANYFNNYDAGNRDFALLKRWIYASLINGVFRSRGAGWIPYKTGVRKILDIVKKHKNDAFPTDEIFQMYINHPIAFTTTYNLENLDRLDQPFLFYLIYDKKKPIRINDKDHIMPRNILEFLKYNPAEINSVKNFQLLDFGTNRGEKNGKAFADWVNNPQHVVDKAHYLSRHAIPIEENLWDERNFLEFSQKRGELILQKILEN